MGFQSYCFVESYRHSGFNKHYPETELFRNVLIESAPFNYGKSKMHYGVPGNLVAFACKRSFELGFDGFVAFTAKSALIDHYVKTLGAVPIGGQRMAIEEKQAIELIKRYFNK
jgi:hypothetical protein